jgi:hypothetical protein
MDPRVLSRSGNEDAANDAAPVDGAAPAPAEPAPPAEPAVKAPDPIPFTKREAALVDKKQALSENPKLVEVENKINATDPLTAVAQGYFSIGSRANVLAMEHTIKTMHALNERYPTFAEFEDLMKKNGARLGQLYQWQMYAYDDATGTISILEDRAVKKAMYEAAGRDYPHAE